MKNKSEIILGDCLNKLKKIKTGSYDHCITDPPYNISNYEGKKKIGWYKSNPTWKENKRFRNYKKISYWSNAWSLISRSISFPISILEKKNNIIKKANLVSEVINKLI